MTQYESNCPLCKRSRTYKTKEGYVRGLTKPCKSCSNSINMGGSGYTPYCACGEVKYEKSSTLCLKCHNKRSRKYYRGVYRLSQYEVTREWYKERVKEGCAICKKRLYLNSKLTIKKGFIDHDHTTGLTRGVLCSCCNKGLGFFKESSDVLQAAARYLKKHSKGN